jgi:hypothetical protein
MTALRDGCTPAQRQALDALQSGEVRAYLVIHPDGWVSPPMRFADAAQRDRFAVQQRAVLVPLVVERGATG